MGLLSGFKRNFRLEQAYQFGRDVYGIDLRKVSASVRPLIHQEMDRLGDLSPQAVFFMIVPAYLGVLDPFKRSELFDGVIQMAEAGALPSEICEIFMFEYCRIDPDDPTQWVSEALGG